MSTYIVVVDDEPDVAGQRTAKALGISVPVSLLATVDEVVE